MLEKFETLREAVVKSEKSFNGNRREIAEQMGLSYVQYRNRLEERNGCRPFDASQLEDIQFITGSSCIAQYFAGKAGGIFIPIHDAELDSEELSEIQIREMAALGEVNVEISKALANDQMIDSKEAKAIKSAAIEAAARVIASKLAAIRVYGAE